MSCGFWIRRKKQAAQKQKEAAKVTEAKNVVKEPTAEETKETLKKTAKKAVKSSDSTTD